MITLRRKNNSLFFTRKLLSTFKFQHEELHNIRCYYNLEETDPVEEEAQQEEVDISQRPEARERFLLQQFNNCSSMRDAKRFHGQVIKTGFEQHVFVTGRIISFCCVSDQGSIDHALSVFQCLMFPDAFIWNTIIRGFARTGRTEEAFLFFQRMRQRCNKPPDNFTFSFLLKLSASMGDRQLGKQLHCCAMKHGFHTHVFVANTIVHLYGVIGQLDNARVMFDEMPRKDVVSWNAFLDGLVRCCFYEDALRVYRRMLESGFKPDDATMVVVLSACSELGDLDSGKWIHSHISEELLQRFPSVANSLIDMYSKCGAVDQAYEIFKCMKDQKNIVSWNSMIVGLALHGRTNEALELFDRMQDLGTEEPNDITFVGVLCACSHGGLVEEGKRYFDVMKSDYRINPTIKHYGCMVDLLGRAGLVREAYELIKSMPMEGNAIVWRSLLASCKVHGDVELGKQVRKQLGELEPDYSSDYVLLSHMYANAGRWNDVSKVREAMNGRRVGKPMPGNSSIDITATANQSEEWI